MKTGLLLRSSRATVEVGMKKSVKGVALNSKVELGTKDLMNKFNRGNHAI